MSWSVMLAGTLKPYDAQVSDLIEAAWQKDDKEVLVTIRGAQYKIELSAKKQIAVADPTKQRTIERTVDIDGERIDALMAKLSGMRPTPSRKTLRQALEATSGDVDRAAAALSAAAAPAPAPARAPAGASGPSAPAPISEPPAKKQKTSPASAGPSSSAAAAAAPSADAPASYRAVLVFAPGAGGTTAQAMKALHEKELKAAGFHVVRCDEEPMGPQEKRWVTMSAGAKANLDHVCAVATRAAAAHPGVPVFLCGASFGNRVLAEALRLRRDSLPAAVDKDALICCGYPLHKVGAPEGADPKRAAHITSLPLSVHTLFVQGDKDEFLLARGLDALRDVMGQMAGQTTLHAIPGGEHTVPKAKGLKAIGATQAQVNQRIVEAISVFVDERRKV